MTGEARDAHEFDEGPPVLEVGTEHRGRGGAGIAHRLFCGKALEAVRLVDAVEVDVAATALSMPAAAESSWACSDARFQSTEHPVHGAHTGCSVTTSSPDTRPVAVITRVSPAPTSRTSSPDLSCPPP
eukprot:CAMPEP_0181392260 /NCGR_PEP_ID=MMETSP1106-20121128/26488_1 /TAXON_ID=81844 /ORGANISM="Mantoniella antarctica, Strain SL-175" /LENGTH=127 /DNA_ID=CAMNT_0023513355 /DNA_START=1144 /DNA_END=1525 /DNA_ORIENTATION=+